MRTTSFALCMLFMLGARSSSAQPRIDTVRHIHPRPGTGLSAIWGYTAPDGREYALVGITGSGTGNTSGGTSIVDITDDNNPRVVTHIVGPNSTWREMKTYKQYAYVVTEANSATGVQIIDLSALPDTARLVRTFSYTQGTKNINRSHTITITDGYMYLNGCAGWSPGGILIFDLRNDPTNPQFVSEYQPQYIHDSYVLRDTIYGAAIYSGGGIFIADARNKFNVQTIGQISYTSSGTHNVWVTKDRRFALSTDEITHPQKNVKFWDISHLPTMPTAPVATFTVDPSSTVHNVHIRGDYAYCSWYNGYALQIIDIRNPQAPVLAAGYSIPGSGLSWEVYPYFPSGKIILGAGPQSGSSTGLWIFRFSELAPRRAVRLEQPANNDTVRVLNALTLQWSKAADLNADPHWYDVHLWGQGLDTTFRANDSLATFTNIAGLLNGQTYRWTVITRDEFNTTASRDTFRFWYFTPTIVREAKDVPRSFALEQNYPNPFSAGSGSAAGGTPSTTFRFQIPSDGRVRLSIFDILGRRVATIVDENLAAGYYQRSFTGSGLASGVYVYRLQLNAVENGLARSYVETRRMVLTR